MKEAYTIQKTKLNLFFRHQLRLEKANVYVHLSLKHVCGLIFLIFLNQLTEWSVGWCRVTIIVSVHRAYMCSHIRFY